MKGIKLNFLCFQRFKTCGASALKIHWRGRNDVNWRKVFDLGGTSLVFIQALDFADMEKQEQEGEVSSPDCVIKRRSFVQVNSGWNIAFWDDSLAWAWAIGFEARGLGSIPPVWPTVSQQPWASYLISELQILHILKCEWKYLFGGLKGTLK